MTISPTNSNYSINANTTVQVSTNTSAFAVIDSNSRPVFEIYQSGKMVHGDSEIAIGDMFKIVATMKRFIMDAAKDTELAERYPYLKDAAYDWLVEEIKQ